MNKRRLTTAIILIALAACHSSCRKEEFAWRPVYGNIYCRTPNPKAGDTIVLAAKVIDAGNRIYHADYRWRGTDRFIGINPTRVTAPDGSRTIEAEPTCSCVFNYPGNYQVRLSVTVKYSMPDADGAMTGVGVNARGSTEIFSSIRID